MVIVDRGQELHKFLLKLFTSVHFVRDPRDIQQTTGVPAKHDGVVPTLDSHVQPKLSLLARSLHS